MKALTVQEASRNLRALLHCAVAGEEITIQDGTSTVLLQPVAAPTSNRVQGREALRQLQKQSRLTSALAESYLREVKAERLAQENCRR